jgi:hypothetical protein
MKLVRFLKARLGERSTWAAIGVGIAGGGALPSPYSWLFIVAGLIGALIPEPAKSPKSESAQ